MDNKQRKNPDFPTNCKICGGILDPLPYFNDVNAYEDEQGRFCKVLARFPNGEPRTFEYTLACRNNPNEHPQLKVVETPCVGFRSVIRADKYDVNKLKI
jgi:hypothetical protein|nr:MAG TPA: hypothetical protein [Caudoviricetes sp.]